MKNMDHIYTREAARSLGLGDEALPELLPLPGDRRGFLLDRACRLRVPFPEMELLPAPRETLPLPAGLEPLRSISRRSGAAGRRSTWLEFRNAEALKNLCALGLLEVPAAERLSAFLALRPCFSPPLRPGLGLLLDRETGAAFPAALLLEGFGMAEEGFRWPLAMNLELTTQCPLRCPQCYVHLQEGRHMPREIALRRLAQAGELGVVTANLSGGETMCYPWLYEVMECARELDMEPDVALSGFGINDKSLDRLIGAGVNGIYVSLNGPTAERNAHTRDGYELALALMQRLEQRHFPNTWINWVVHDSNADTLPDMIRLAEEHGVHGLMVMAFKPDSHNALPSLPSSAQMETLAHQIREYSGPVELCVETCYSTLRALTSQSFFGNRNRGPFRGCGAGRDSFSVALDGRLTPCRHLDIREDWENIGDYWDHSPLLRELRRVQATPEEPCRGCALADACRHCMAVNWKLHGQLARGDATCPLAGAYRKESAHV